MTLSETAAEILYILGVLKFLELEVAYLVTVHVDNVGAIYLAQLAATGSRTRHVDIWYHFVCNYIENGILKLQFVCTGENTVDVFTNNLWEELFEQHTKMFSWTSNRKSVENSVDVEKNNGMGWTVELLV